MKHYSNTMRFLAVSMKSIVPQLPVLTPKERMLYVDFVGNYLPNSGSDIDFDKFAEDWNAGKLS